MPAVGTETTGSVIVLCILVWIVVVAVPSAPSDGLTSDPSPPAGPEEGLGLEPGLELEPSPPAGADGLGPDPAGLVSEGFEPPPPPFSAGGVGPGRPPSVTGQTVVEMAMICVVTDPSLPGQSVTVGAHDVTV